MKLKKFLLIALIALLGLTPASAQSNEQEAQATYKLVQLMLQTIPQQAQMVQSLYGMAQQTGNQQQMQLCQMEYEMHQAMYQGLQGLAQNPQQLMNKPRRDQVLAGITEYRYRASARDMRPYNQIQGNLAQYVQQERYNASVAGINANTAAMTSGHHQRMNTMHAQQAAHQRNMNSMQNQYAADQQSWNNQQNSNYASHQQFVHGINNEYRYVDPNTNQSYWVPMSNENPHVQYNDGTVAPLQPYHNY